MSATRADGQQPAVVGRDGRGGGVWNLSTGRQGNHLAGPTAIT